MLAALASWRFETLTLDRSKGLHSPERLTAMSPFASIAMSRSDPASETSHVQVL